MRGVDYRVKKEARGETEGIALLVLNTFDTKRAYIQGLGRVGRYNECSLRFIWEALQEPVNKKKETAIFAKLRMALAGKRKPSNKNQKSAAGQSMLTFGTSKK